MNEKIGFIGLGAMGNPMAANLSKAGNTVYVYDVSEQAVQRACDENDKMIACDTLTFLAENSDIIFASLPNGPIVTSVMQNEIIGSCKRDTIIVDLSSVAPETSKTLYSLAKEKGVEYLDAPVSGGV
ncbi:MAG: NAD(P)-dependent oxidoreductase, partial [Wujia sp.]